MTLLNLNKNFSLKNMFKSKYLLKPLVAIVILQMVLVPVAPVLAEEIQNFSLKASTSTPVVYNIQTDDAIVAPTGLQLIMPPLSSDTIVTHDDPFLLDAIIQPQISTISLTAPITVATSSADIIVAIPTAVTSSEFVAVDVAPMQIVEQTSSTLSENIESKQSIADNILDNLSIIKDSVVSSTNQAVGNFLEVIDKVTDKLADKINSQETLVIKDDVDDFVKRINYIEHEEVKIDNTPFKIFDAVTDIANVSATSSIYKIYKNKRLLFKDEFGEFKIRPDGWNLFFEDSRSRIINNLKTGYEFYLPVEGSDLNISSGNFDLGEKTIHPNIPKINRQQTDNAIVTNLSDLYPGVDVVFRDFMDKRERKIIIKEPLNILSGESAIFWEHYVLPKGSSVLNASGDVINGISEMQGQDIVVEDTGENKFFISSAVAFDANHSKETDIGWEFNAVNLSQKVIVDYDKGEMKIGIIIDGTYLSDPSTIYPVTIDPIYSACQQGMGGLPCSIQDSYLRTLNGGSDTFSAYDSSALFAGKYKNGTSYYTRHAALKFNVEWAKIVGTISNAKLYMYYRNFGLGAASSRVLTAKRLTNNVSMTKDTPYSSVRQYLSEDNLSTSIPKTPTGQYYGFDVNSTVNLWKSGYYPDYGLVVEPSGSWSSGNTPPTSWSDLLAKFDDSSNSSGYGPFLQFTSSVNQVDLTQSYSYLTTPSTIVPGNTITLDIRVKNVGLMTASLGEVQYFVKNGCNYSNYIGQLSVGALNAGNSSNLVFGYSVPSSATLGTYYLGYSIDAPGNVSESNENNNKGCFSPITVSGQPDFTPSSFSITDTKLRYSGLGDTITVNGRIRNLGNVGNGSVGYILRLKSLTDSLTYNLTSISPSTLNLSAGYDQYVNLTGTVPSNMPYYANYTVEVILDSSATIAESDENNNIIASSNNVAVQQYYTGGGGGGGSGSTLDTDGDGVPNTAELTIGAKVNGANTIKSVDKVKTATVKTNKNDGASPKSAQASVNNLMVQGAVHAGDPVNMRTGALEFNQTDFSLGGRGIGLNLVRSYNSKLSDFSGRVGNGWFDSYDIYYAQDATTKDVQVYLGGHLAAYFTCPSQDGVTFIPEIGRYETLTKNPSTGLLEYRTLEGIKYVFSKSVGGGAVVLATQIVDTNNNTVTLGYTTVREIPLLTSVSDSSGRQLTFTYPVDTDPLWDKIKEVRENVDGVSHLVAQYTYDGSKNLTLVHQESSYSAEVVKVIDHKFEYNSAGRMLRYTDPRGTVLHNEYGELVDIGRITKQYESNPLLGGSDKRLIYEFIYTDVPDPSVPGSTHCALVKNYRDTNSYTEYLCFNSNELKIYSKKGNNIEKWEYNADGMATKSTDALGNVINYTYDAKRRLTSQVQVDNADWHTVTTFEYENNFNRLTKKTETVTALTGKIPPAPRVTNFTIDSATGNLTAVQYPDTTTESFQYDTYGNVKKYTNKNNAVTDYIYDTNGNYLSSETISVTQADNTAQTIKKQYGYDGYGHRTSYVDPNNKTYSYGYDSRGNLRFETDPLANSKYYKYDKEDHRESEIDALGHEIQYVYDTDTNASLLSVIKLSSNGNITNSRQYDYVGNVVKEVDGNGNNKNYSYTAENWILNTAEAKRTVTNEYYANGWLKKQTDSEGRRTDYFYDTRGNKTETRAYYDAINFISNKFVYDGFNRVISQTDGKNNVTNFVYDISDRLVSQTDVKGGVTSYFYDAVGNKIGELSPLATADVTLQNSYGYSTAYFYDGANRLIKKVNADNKIALYLYDANGNVLKTIENQNSDGSLATHVTQFAYFDNNWKKTETDANDGIAEFTYYAVGTLKTKKSPAGLVTTYIYDDFNRVTKETDNAGLSTDYTYDANNNKKTITYPDTTKTQYNYNSLNLLETTKDAMNGLRQFEYDGAGNKTKEINKLGKVTSFVYDKMNRLTQETNPTSTVTSYIYDKNSNRTAETVGAKTTAYEYDELNRNTKITYPGNKSESVTYDADSNIATKTDGKGQKIVYTFDKLNRSASKLLPGGFTVQYAYDNWNNLTSLIDESGTTQYVYDKLNRNTNETKTFVGLAAKNYSVIRAYNADSQLSAVTDAANRKIDYAYNPRGLLENVKYGATTLVKYTYSDFGKPKSLEYGNGIKTDLNFDELNRVKNISTNSGTTTLFSQNYTYDAQSNRTAMVEDKSSTTTYSYDDLEQLTNVNINNNGVNNVLGYSYDIYGNRTTQSNPLSTANYTYTAATNELDKVVYNNRLSVTSLFDGNGSLAKETYTKLGKTDKEIVYTWDTQNRLAQINYQYTNRPAFMPAVPDNTLNFTYDDFGNRTKKQSTNGTHTYYFNSGNTVLNEIGSTGTTTKSIVYGMSQIAEIDSNNNITYTHQDTLGSTVLTTDQSGSIITKYQYDPFGQLIGQDGKTNTNYLYTNQEYDQESELYYYNARYYL